MIEKTNRPPIHRPAHIVLIHGLAGNRLTLWPLAYQLRRSGFTTSTFGYASWWWSIEHHASRFTQHLNQIANDQAINHFHIVAHSMGSIVTRTALLESRFEKLGRIVMLAAPNQGSPVARVLGTGLPFCKTLRQISNHSASFVCNLPEPAQADIGIVAAKHDRVIPEPNSHLEIESDHVVLSSGHNGLLVRPSAARQIVEFLNHGKFQPVKST
jgi:pimeloyl-ACP methyl ester carboxylesterase